MINSDLTINFGRSSTSQNRAIFGFTLQICKLFKIIFENILIPSLNEISMSKIPEIVTRVINRWLAGGNSVAASVIERVSEDIVQETKHLSSGSSESSLEKYKF